MMRAAKISNNAVVNVINVSSLDFEGGLVECPDHVVIGWNYINGVFVAPTKTPSEVRSEMTAEVQRHLDAAAKDRGYDSILSACSYASVTNAFQAEGIAFLEWRSACWAHCYAVLDDVQAGNRLAPTAVELLAELPVLVLS